MALENPRSRNSRSGSIGVGVRRSQARKAAISTIPALIAPMTSALPQPTSLARIRPQVSPKPPAAARSRPGMSRWGRGPKLSVSLRAASGIRAMPTGTLSQKIQCQEIPPVTAPPTTGPAATARPLMPPHNPIAAPRFSTGKAALMSVSVSGMTIAAPVPCTTRAAMRVPTSGERAAAAEAAVKMPMPTVNIRRRPKRSPSAAPVNSMHAKARL